MSVTSDKPSVPWSERPRALLRSLLQLNDTPHSIALGAALGMWIGLTPTGGIQMILVMLTALVTAPLFRFNRPAALMMVYVSNPITTIPLLWGCYKVGTWFVTSDVSNEQLSELFRVDAERNLGDAVWGICVEIGWPMLVGCLIVATISALLTYPFVLWLVKRFRATADPAHPAAAEPSVPKLTVFPPSDQDLLADAHTAAAPSRWESAAPVASGTAGATLLAIAPQTQTTSTVASR